MQTQLTILGVKQFKGEMEGQSYDHTKIIYSLPFPRSAIERNVGLDAQIATYGKSDNYAQFLNRKYPFVATCEVELTTKGMDILHVELPKVLEPAKA